MALAMYVSAHDIRWKISSLRYSSVRDARERGNFSLWRARVHKSAPRRPELPAVSAYFVYKGCDRVDACVR